MTTSTDHPPLTDAERAAVPGIRTAVEALLAGPGVEVTDRLVGYVFAMVRANREQNLREGYEAGRARADAMRLESLRKARANGALVLDTVATEVATVCREASPADASEQVVGALAELIDLQRATDRAIVLAELERRQRVASTYPDLEQSATASAALLSLVASLIDAGLVPDEVAVAVAQHQAARREQQERGAVAAAGERAGVGTTKPSRTTLRQAKEQALAFLREAQKLEGNGATQPLPGVGKVEPLALGVVGVTETGHREPRTYSADQAVQLGLALLGAAYEAQGAAKKKARR